MWAFSRLQKNKRGFTLIEVVLVLAIGSLVFLIAFLAFQQVSRNRRDTQRRSDMRRMIGELENFFQDNSLYPSFQKTVTYVGTASTYNAFQAAYLTPYKDPQTNAIYVFKEPTVDVPDLTLLRNSLTQPGDYTYIPYWQCTSNSGMAYDGTFNNKKYAVAMKLEKGIICEDNTP